MELMEPFVRVSYMSEYSGVTRTYLSHMFHSFFLVYILQVRSVRVQKTPKMLI